MSSICFHTRDREARVGGRERHYCAMLVNNMSSGMADLEGLLRFTGEKMKFYLAEMGINHPVEVEHYFSSFGRDKRVVGGEEFPVFGTQLNTVMVYGSDEMRLAARIHGQCELFCFVEEENRGWLAGLIRRGLKTGIFRGESQGYGKGWGGVIALLEDFEGSPGPVVVDTSVCDSFPSPAPYKEEFPDGGDHTCSDEDAERCRVCEYYEKWDELGEDEKWTSGLAQLRDSGDADFTLEMKPSNWSAYRFNNEKTVVDLARAIDVEAKKLENGVKSLLALKE